MTAVAWVIAIVLAVEVIAIVLLLLVGAAFNGLTRFRRVVRQHRIVWRDWKVALGTESNRLIDAPRAAPASPGNVRCIFCGSAIDPPSPCENCRSPRAEAG